MSIPESTPEMTRWCALVMAIICFISMAYSIVRIAEAERTGVANYDSNPDTSEPEPVLKASAPARFHDAIYLFEGRIVFEGVLGMVCFWFYRRLSN